MSGFNLIDCQTLLYGEDYDGGLVNAPLGVEGIRLVLSSTRA
jgi:hypothetical protein